MARQDDPDSANSQFFINARDNHHLDQLGYTVFGRVTSGLNVIEDIELVATQVVGPLTDLPVTPITIDWLRRAPVAE